MIIGTGLLARAFSYTFSEQDSVIIYAAGVSNSNCTDESEFLRERTRLGAALENSSKIDTFVYFGTCSVADPIAKSTPYVQHKLSMERMVKAHPNNLILRLPQVAGNTPNPHTLLNFLYARIYRSEKFNLWSNAKRNIIDVDDIVSIALQLIANKSEQNTTFNIANSVNYLMIDIVSVMENILNKRAIYDLVERGSEYNIDTSEISSFLMKTNVKFDDDYLINVITKYYWKHISNYSALIPKKLGSFPL
jgi:nucleoside-diphosphate-sugar epimerase